MGMPRFESIESMELGEGKGKIFVVKTAYESLNEPVYCGKILSIDGKRMQCISMEAHMTNPPQYVMNGCLGLQCIKVY